MKKSGDHYCEPGEKKKNKDSKAIRKKMEDNPT